jgi:hypothetical protein
MAYVGKNPRSDSTTLTNQGAATVSNPASGSHKILNRNGQLKVLDSSGVESSVGGGSSGINVIESSSDANGWVASGGGISVTTSTTASDLPLGGVIDTAIKVTPSSSTDYVRYRWTMPESLKNRKLQIEWYQRALSGYASGDLKLEIYKNSASNYSGSYTEFALSTDSSGTSAIPNATGYYSSNFDTDGGDYYEMRLVRTAGTTAINFASVSVGPKSTPQGAVVGDWVSFTPTGSWSTNTTYTGRYRRVGDSIDIRYFIALSGTPTAASLSVNMPTGFTIDSTKYPGNNRNTVGRVLYYDNGGASTGQLLGNAQYGSTTTIDLLAMDDGAASEHELVSITDSAPIAAVSGSRITVTIDNLAVAEWAGSGTVNVAQNDVEYAYNSSTSDLTDTASFAYGPGGGQFANFTATRSKRVRFLTPIQSTDEISFEITENSGVTWSRVETAPGGIIQPYSIQNTVSCGVLLAPVTGSTTDIDVQFQIYRILGGATFGAAGTNWSAIDVSDTYKWRVKKVKSGVAVGFGLADTAGNAGLVNPYSSSGAGVVYSGTYTPTFTSSTNVPIGTGVVSQYIRVGKMVTVSGSVTIDATAGAFTASEFELSLPIASNLSAATDLNGVVAGVIGAGAAFESGYVIGNATTDRALVIYNSATAASHNMVFTFTYEIK